MSGMIAGVGKAGLTGRGVIEASLPPIITAKKRNWIN
jgi:hypothetical protein